MHRLPVFSYYSRHNGRTRPTASLLRISLIEYEELSLNILVYITSNCLISKINCHKYKLIKTKTNINKTRKIENVTYLVVNNN